MKRIILLASLALSINAFTQIPSYVPTNGLVGWWPFNGNANDESGNGNNGIPYGATLTSDRYGIINKAYSFDGVNDSISINNSNSLSGISDSITMCAWININNWTNGWASAISKSKGTLNQYRLVFQNTNNIDASFEGKAGGATYSVTLNNWFYVVVSIKSNTFKYYVNGSLITTTTGNANVGTSSSTTNLSFGCDPYFFTEFLNGSLDDIAIYNRVLTPQEITILYQGCNNFTANLNVSTLNVNTNTSAQFIASSNETNTTFQWQTNPSNVGWLNISNNTMYSGTTTSNLNINSTQLSNHLQPFRVIANAGNCKDTSDVAILKINDTCILTRFISVTDTLVINSTLTGLNPPNNLNTLKVYPNPAKTHITIDYGNFGSMNGYKLKIVNSIGQTMFTTPINQQTSFTDLSAWERNSIYFLQIIDAQNNIIENRKIVLQ